MADNPIISMQNVKGAFPDQSVINVGDAIPDALVLTQSTQAGTVAGDSQTVRVAYVNDDPDADFVKEGANIGQKSPAITELNVQTSKLALLTVISNEAWQNNGIPDLIGTSLGRALTKKADFAFLQGKPDNAGLGVTGITNIAGILDGGSLSDDLSPIVDAIAKIGANGGSPTALIMGYDAWGHLLKLTAKDGRPLIAPDVANSAAPTLFGIPVILNTQAAANTILVIDSSTILSAVGNVSEAVSADRFFDADSVGVRVAFRFGFGIYRPDRNAKITVAASSASASK